MYYPNQSIIVRMNPEGVFLGNGVCVPLESVQVGHSSDKEYAPHSDIYWIRARVVHFTDGVLELDVSAGHPRNVNSFFSQHAAEGVVKKLILSGNGTIVSRLTGGNQPVPSWARSEAKAKESALSSNTYTSRPKAPKPRELPAVEYKQAYRFKL
jgi:hypothetical protein